MEQLNVSGNLGSTLKRYKRKKMEKCNPDVFTRSLAFVFEKCLEIIVLMYFRQMIVISKFIF